MQGKHSTYSATSLALFVCLFLIMYIFAVLGWNLETPRHTLYHWAITAAVNGGRPDGHFIRAGTDGS